MALLEHHSVCSECAWVLRRGDKLPWLVGRPLTLTGRGITALKKNMHIALPPRKSGKGRLKPPGYWLALLLLLCILQACVLQVTEQNWIWGYHNWGENSTIGTEMTGPRSEPRWGSYGHCWSLLKWCIRSHPGLWEWLLLYCSYPTYAESPCRPQLPCRAILQQARDNGGDGEYEMKISPAISTNEKCHSYQHSLASKCEWGIPKLWSSRCHHPPWWLLRSWGNARSSHLPLLKLNKETGFGPRYLRCIWKEWIQWVQRLTSSHTLCVKTS